MNSNGDRNPVLLIHGIFGKSGVFNKMSEFAHAMMARDSSSLNAVVEALSEPLRLDK